MAAHCLCYYACSVLVSASASDMLLGSRNCFSSPNNVLPEHLPKALEKITFFVWHKLPHEISEQVDTEKLKRPSILKSHEMGWQSYCLSLGPEYTAFPTIKDTRIPRKGP